MYAANDLQNLVNIIGATRDNNVRTVVVEVEARIGGPEVHQQSMYPRVGAIERIDQFFAL